MNIIKYLAPAVFLIAASSCEKTIDMKIAEYPSKLVINAQLNPDSVVFGNISKSLAILDESSSPFVPVAEVSIYENESIIETLPINSRGFFRSNNFKPKPGNNYKIEASAKDFQNASGETLIPNNNLDFAFDTITELRSRSNSNTLLRFVIKLTIQDQPNIDNYYIFGITSDYKYTIVNFDPASPKIRPLDESKHDTTIIIPYSIETNSTVPEMNSYGYNDEFDVIDRSGGIGLIPDQNNYISGSQFAFSDITFSGKKTSIDFETEANTYNDTVNLKITLREVSKDYYTYLKSMAIYRNSGDYFAEKVQVFTNIKNGYGILGSESKVEKNLVRFKK
jgi:hypothetical protein